MSVWGLISAVWKQISNAYENSSVIYLEVNQNLDEAVEVNW